MTIYIKKRDNYTDRIVGKITGNKLESDDELLNRIIEEIWDWNIKKKVENMKINGDILNTLKVKLVHPYYVSLKENPEFELYKYEKDFKKLKETYNG